MLKGLLPQPLRDHNHFQKKGEHLLKDQPSLTLRKQRTLNPVSITFYFYLKIIFFLITLFLSLEESKPLPPLSELTGGSNSYENQKWVLEPVPPYGFDSSKGGECGGAEEPSGGINLYENQKWILEPTVPYSSAEKETQVMQEGRY